MERLIVVEGASKLFGSRVALDSVDLTVASGEIVGLLGPNGAGKSTTLALIAALLPADRGTVTVNGHRLPRGARAARAALGFVPQRVAVYPSLTARENLHFFARMQGLPGPAAVAATMRVLELVALDGRADEPVAGFSSGMRRRLNLACGILHRPRVLLLDEPTVGIDPQSRERIFEAVAGMARKGTAILYSTHDMQEAEHLCQRVVLLDAGRVVAAGTPAELVASSGMTSRVLLRTARPLPPAWLNGINGARLLTDDGVESVIAVAGAAAVSAVLMAATHTGANVLELTLQRPNLADAFFKYTGRALRDDDGAPADGI